MAEADKLNIDSIIARLLEGKYWRSIYVDSSNGVCGIRLAKCQKSYEIIRFLVRGARPGKNVQLTESEIRGLCLKSREIFLSQPILLELEAPLKICGKLNFFLL